jgi:hypothetical protein
MLVVMLSDIFGKEKNDNFMLLLVDFEGVVLCGIMPVRCRGNPHIAQKY